MTKKKNQNINVLEPDIIEIFYNGLEEYKEAFLKANYNLEKSKLDGEEITLHLVNKHFEDSFLTREALFQLIESASRNDKIKMASEVLELYKYSSGLTKRAFIDVRAYFINQGIC